MQTPLNSDLSLLSSDFEQGSVSYIQLKKAACAAQYHEACSLFLCEPSLESLKQLNHTLSNVDPHDVDVSEAERLVEKARMFLDCAKAETNPIYDTQLTAIQLILRFQVCKPGSRWIVAQGVTDKAASAFQSLLMCQNALSDGDINDGDDYSIDDRYCIDELKDMKSSFFSNDYMEKLISVIQLWVSLLELNQLEEHHIHPLLACAMHWVFSPEYKQTVQVSLKFLDLIAIGYVVLPSVAREQVLHQIVSLWLKTPNCTAVMTDLILKLLAKIGTVPHSIWNVAVSFHTRESLERESLEKHTAAISCANAICRRLIDGLWQASKTNSTKIELCDLLKECSNRLTSFHWPTSELFISAFVSSLFKLSKIIRSQKYPGFMLEILKVLYENLSKTNIRKEEISKQQSTAGADPLAVSKVVTAALSHSLDRNQALYLASRQMVMNEQPYFDYHNALFRSNPIILAPTKAEWLTVLGQWPIINYHSQIVKLLLDMANYSDLRENLQVDLFKILEKVVLDDPDLFEESWLDRIGWAMPAVCEALIPIVQHIYNIRGTTRLLEKLCSRVSSPGAHQFKRKIMSLLISYDQKVPLKLIWETLLVAVCDADHTIKTQAVENCNSWLQTHEANYELAQALGEARAGEGAILVQRGLKRWLTNLESTRIRSKIEHSKVQRLVIHLINESKLELALTFIEVDGHFTPSSCLRSLFENIISETPNSEVRLNSLKIIENAMSARPRLIVAPKLATYMFFKLLECIKVCAEAEMEPITGILGQLVYLGGTDDQVQRTEVLNKVFESARKLASSAQRPTICKQAILISAGSRFWPIDLDSVTQFVHWLIDWAVIQPIDQRLLGLRMVFALASYHGSLFSDAKVEKYLASFPPNSAEASCLTRQLLKLLLTPPYASAHQKETYDEKESANISAVEIATNGMIQKQLFRLKQIAGAEEDVMVLRVIVKALDDNLIVADECIPLVTSLSFSRKPAVAQTALRAFVMLCEKGSKHLGPKFVEGLRNTKLPVINSRPLALMWRALKNNLSSKELKAVVENFVTLLDWSTELDLLKALIRGIEGSDLDSKDMKMFIVHIESMTNLFDARHHDNSATAKVCLLFIFALWLRRRYGLCETNFGSNEDEMEAMDCDLLWKLISQRENLLDFIGELWKLPDYYGSTSMNKLIFNYGNSKDTLSKLDEPMRSKKIKTE